MEYFVEAVGYTEEVWLYLDLQTKETIGYWGHFMNRLIDCYEKEAKPGRDASLSLSRLYDGEIRNKRGFRERLRARPKKSYADQICLEQQAGCIMSLRGRRDE